MRKILYEIAVELSNKTFGDNLQFCPIVRGEPNVFEWSEKSR